MSKMIDGGAPHGQKTTKQDDSKQHNQSEIKPNLSAATKASSEEATSTSTPTKLNCDDNSKEHDGKNHGQTSYNLNLQLDIRKFVDVIFTDSQSISLEQKAVFGNLMRTEEARLLFAKSVDDYRVNSKRVSELTFYSLAQYFSIVLLECLLAEDFRPAKIIMNMMFTYYYEQNYDKIPPRERLKADLLAEQEYHMTSNSFGQIGDFDAEEYSDKDKSTTNSDHVPKRKLVRTYLYTLLKDQEIFKSIRFWTSAFYETVIIERNNHPVFIDKQRGKLSNEKRDEELDCSKNITFGLLGSFIHNMCLLDLGHEFCHEFLNKHSTIAGLSDHQLKMLRANSEAMFKETQTDKSQATAGERLSNFLQKLTTRLNNSSASSGSNSTQKT